MTYIIFSPLEQFEFYTIGIGPIIGNTKLAVLEWLYKIDHYILVQEIIGLYYDDAIKNTPSIIVEGFFNLNLIEVLTYIDHEKEIIKFFFDNINIDQENNSELYTYMNTTFYQGELTQLFYSWLNIYNSAFIVLVLYILVFITFNIIGKNNRYLNVWNYLIDLFINFLLETFLSLADRRLLKFFPIFVVFFIVIFLSNLTALVPLSFCLTSNLWLTLTLSFSVWVSVTLLAIIVRGHGFFTGFIPSNVPAALKGFITVIEIISYLARAISLGVRIFANMLAGHSLVHILSDLVETCIISFNHISLRIFGIFPALILTFILFIEFGICFLQALVFVILTAIYLKEAFGFSSH